MVSSYASDRPQAWHSIVRALPNLQERQPDQRLGMDARGHGVQLRLAVDPRHVLRMQGCTLLVPGDSKGIPTLKSLQNLRKLASMKKFARKARVILDLFFLVLTLSCLGFALYRSWH